MDRKQKKRKLKGVVYSTNPHFEYEDEHDNIETLSAKEQKLDISKNKHKGGKTTIIIKGFIGDTNDLKELGKMLKSKCAVGGSIKNNQIIIQGDVREKIMEILQREGYNCNRVGG